MKFENFRYMRVKQLRTKKSAVISRSAATRLPTRGIFDIYGSFIQGDYQILDPQWQICAGFYNFLYMYKHCTAVHKEKERFPLMDCSDFSSKTAEKLK